MKRTTGRGLAETLFPLARRRILGALYSEPGRELHLREIMRRTELAPATVQREVVALAEVGILERRTEGRQVYYRANRACPIFAELRGLVVKTVGVADVLREALEPLGDRVEAAAVFGSVADGTEMADSDVDLLIVGAAKLKDLVPHLRAARAALGREVNAVVMSKTEFRSKARDGDHFVSTVLGRPRIAVKGSIDDVG
jgi:predicted nucleotidyltransferase